ncbi:hypothetical protein RhiTH_009703 [Rhizoctonia solani]
MSPEPAVSYPDVHPGPSDADPLTDDELSLLLAIPRAAESTPNSTLFRLPLGPHPSMGFVDTTCAEVRSIVARLASTWKTKLSELLRKPDESGCEWSIGPGTTICIMVEPSFHGIFHLLAFWAIGCTVQFVSVSDPSVGIDQLNECECKVMVCSGFDEEWIIARGSEFNGVIVSLPEEEQAHILVKNEKHGHATPVAFVHFANFHVLRFDPSVFVDWAKTLDVGAITCSSGLVRQIPAAMLETHAEFFRSLFSFAFTGSSLDCASSSVFERLGIFITNIYGSSEFGRILNSSNAPYTHLRPWGDTPAPLVRAISEYASDGTRYVELWISCKTSLRLSHHLSNGGVPVKLEPFPGDGPHKGEPAINLEDIFQERTIVNESNSKIETVYIHAGRHSDQLRLSGKGYGNIDAASYEAALMSELSSRMGQSDCCYPWTIDAVQLFGGNMPCTALIVQLGSDPGLAEPSGTDLLQDFVAGPLYKSVVETNQTLGFISAQRVHPGKRMLLIGSSGTILHGPDVERLSGSCPLSVTHKRTPKRWENVCKFKPWLDGLDFSEP